VGGRTRRKKYEPWSGRREKMDHGERGDVERREKEDKPRRGRGGVLTSSKKGWQSDRRHAVIMVDKRCGVCEVCQVKIIIHPIS
jgi:hypothetical protein